MVVASEVMSGSATSTSHLTLGRANYTASLPVTLAARCVASEARSDHAASIITTRSASFEEKPLQMGQPRESLGHGGYPTALLEA